MMRAIIVLTLSLSLSNAEFNPYQPGELEVKAEIISKWSLSHTLHVWSPSVQGNYPIVYSLTGFAGLIDPATESEVFSHIASHGFIVVSPHKLLTLPTSQYDATWLV